MHYYAYLLVFLCVEPIAISFFVVLMSAGASIDSFYGTARVLFLSIVSSMAWGLSTA